MRDLSGGGDVKVQRLKDLPFPRSEVIEFDLGKNDISKFMDKEEQAQHDAMVEAFSNKRKDMKKLQNFICRRVLRIAWCAICGKDMGCEPRQLRLHDQKAHPERGRSSCCGCARTVTCSY